MRLGAMLGRDAVEKIEDQVNRWASKDADKRRQRESAKRRKLGKTVPYQRGDR